MYHQITMSGQNTIGQNCPRQNVTVGFNTSCSASSWPIPHTCYCVEFGRCGSNHTGVYI